MIIPKMRGLYVTLCCRLIAFKQLLTTTEMVVPNGAGVDPALILVNTYPGLQTLIDSPDFLYLFDKPLA